MGHAGHGRPVGPVGHVGHVCNTGHVRHVGLGWDSEADAASEGGEAPEMICSDSFYCNWTNNPQMWELAWWNKECVVAPPLAPRSAAPRH